MTLEERLAKEHYRQRKQTFQVLRQKEAQMDPISGRNNQGVRVAGTQE